MDKNRLLKIMIIVVVIIIFVVLGLMVFVKKDTPNIVINSPEVGHIDFSEVDLINNKNELFAVKEVLDKYFEAIGFLDAKISDLNIDTDINSEEQKELLQEYTTNGVRFIKELLDEEVLQEIKLSDNEVVNTFKQYKCKNYEIKNIYTVEKNIVNTLYYVELLLDYNKEYNLVIKTDMYYNTCSIYPMEYLDKKEYTDETCIEKEFNYTNFEYIKENDYNQFNLNEATDQKMATYYIENFGNIMINNHEQAYDLLNEEYKQKRFPTFEVFDKFIDEAEKGELSLSRFIIEKKDDKTIYTCMDQYECVYKFEETSLFNYNVQLDDYTLEIEQYKANYKKANGEKRCIFNIDKFFRMINMQDYETAYSVLDENFKQNNFNTLADFEKYMRNNTFKYNIINPIGNSKIQTDIYSIEMFLTDATKQDQSTKPFNIIIKLLDDMNFVMSFEVN